MADKTMRDERDRRPDADAASEFPGHRDDHLAAGPPESAAGPSTDGVDRDEAIVPSSKRAAAPLITAVEIENFKGIGRPMRVEFKPITLLFGNNSAGKSTVLHALCYAHEILSHGNVDVHKTDIGGDRVDLGGFRNLVHAHDLARPVRLRFELDLTDWETPTALFDKLRSNYADTGVDFELTELEARVTSGWIELQAETRGDQPLLTSYELSINDARVGRLLLREPSGVDLVFSPTHPMLQWSTESTQTNLHTDRVREANEADQDGWKQTSMDVVSLFSPLPRWNEALLLDDGRSDLHDGRSDADLYDRIVFTTTASILFVGIGQALRDELARVRYIGPVRDLHPQTTTVSSARRRAFETFAADFIHGSGAIGTRPPAPASWADGSAAWTYLHDTPYQDLLDAVNTWLERRDRLDTGYALRVRSRVTIYEDKAGLVSKMREYHQLRQTFGNADGSIDLTAWSLAEARAIVDKTDPDATKAALDHCDRLRERFASAAGGASILESVEELQRAVLRHGLEKFEAPASIIEPGMRREAERNLRVVEDLRRLLTLPTQEIESQITGSGEDTADMADSSETLTRAYCRRLNDLLPTWERDAPLWICTTGIIDGLRSMQAPGDLPDAVKAWTRIVEDASSRKDRSVEVEQFLAEFRSALQTSVASARRNYRRLTALVAKIEGGKFSSQEIEALAAEIAARPPQREIELITTKSELPVRVADVGVGISQVLPVVVAALDPNRPGITAIEQPELHLHPKLQVELGDLFAQPVDDGRIFLLENHSEHLMLRLLRRIEETHSGELPEGKPPLRPEQVSVVFIEQIDGEVRATPLRIDETGEFIDRWPQGFFDERADELF